MLIWDTWKEPGRANAMHVAPIACAPRSNRCFRMSRLSSSKLLTGSPGATHALARGQITTNAFSALDSAAWGPRSTGSASTTCSLDAAAFLRCAARARRRSRCRSVRRFARDRPSEIFARDRPSEISLSDSRGGGPSESLTLT